MGCADHETIDFVSIDAEQENVVLSLVEERPWGSRGELLPDLQAKLSTYLTFALDGELLQRYPEAAGKRIRFRLHYGHPLTQRELDFIDIVRRHHLDPEGIVWQEGPIDPPAHDA
jgi:hypothetical protein